MMAQRIVMMGVSGCGKSTMGLALSRQLGFAFLEGDSFHPPENIQAMAAGLALDDAMRAPWLRTLASALHAAPSGVVASCSALRRSYRDILRTAGPVVFVHLAIDLAEASARMQTRPGHFMNPALAKSQRDSLEPLGPDEEGFTLDGAQPHDRVLDLILRRLDHAQQGG